MKFSPQHKGFMLLMAIVLLVVGVMYFFNVTGWKKLKTPGHAPSVVLSAAAYDKNSNNAVLFGGISLIYTDGEMRKMWSSETWTWDGEKWERIQTETAPSPREKHAMAYDENMDVIVLFGGQANGAVFNDTWEWNGENWIEKTPLHIPLSRCCHAMVYDPVRKGVVLYGGWDGAEGFWDDTWLWDGNDWIELPYSAPMMSGHVLSQYPPYDAVISMQTSNMGTWSLSSAGWTDLFIQSPPSRSTGRADYGDGSIVFFGGSRDGTLMNDTWVFKDDVWYQFRLPRTPSARYGHVLFYDTSRGSFIMFGGASYTEILNDTWELKLSSDVPLSAIRSTSTP
jgi:hypothetical protein